MAELNGADPILFDLIVIGGGPGGYVAAIRGAQLGLKTLCVDKEKTYGGTCLNVGCIPSKALLESSEQYYQAKHGLSVHGVRVSSVELDLPQMMKRKEGIVLQLTQGLAGLLKKKKVETAQGWGTLLGQKAGRHCVEVVSDRGEKKIFSAPKVLLATGSEPSVLSQLPFNGTTVVSSTEALSFHQVPDHLIVVGGGVIGLEMGSVWKRLGAQVTVIEFQKNLCPFLDAQLGRELQKQLSQLGIEFILGTECTGLRERENRVEVLLRHRETGQQDQREGDKVLVATGRRPYIRGLGLEKVGLSVNDQGRLAVNNDYETSVAGIYAIGDLIPGPMLAHKAEEEAMAAVERMVGQAGHVNYHAIPNVIYTWPEVATVGDTEEELKKNQVNYRVGVFPFLPNGRAKAMQATTGWVKVLADAHTDRLLGVHMIGPWVSDLIMEAVAVLEFGGSAEDLARLCHPHPTLSEVVKEAALAVDQRSIHG